MSQTLRSCRSMTNQHSVLCTVTALFQFEICALLHFQFPHLCNYVINLQLKSSFQLKRQRNQPTIRTQWLWASGWDRLGHLYLVEDVSLAAQVQVRQDAGRSDVGDGQTGLRDTGGNQSRLALTKTRKQVRELGESTWKNNENNQHRVCLNSQNVTHNKCFWTFIQDVLNHVNII